MEDYADMVKLHYQQYENKDRYKKHIHSKFNEIEKYSDIDSMVFKYGNEIVVAMRGLQPSSPRDQLIGTEIFLEDAYQQSGFDFESSTKKKKGISIFPNKYGEILKKEQNKIEELKKEYPNKKIVLAGHSRGGRKVIDLGEHNQLEYHAFQPAEMNRQGQAAMNFLVGSAVGGLETPGAEYIRESIPFIKNYIPNTIISPVVSNANINKELFKSYYDRDTLTRGGRLGNNLLFEFAGEGFETIQKNMVTSAIGSKSIGESTEKFISRSLIPKITERGIETLGGGNPLYEPTDFTRMPKTEYDRKSLELIQPFVSFFKGETKPQRKPPTESISNIYKTENDRVSKFYEPTELVKPKQYAYGFVDHYLFGDHSIDHFISKELFNSVNENKPIEENNNLEPNISPTTSLPYKINSRELCKRYGSAYSPHCKKIFS